MSLGKSFELHGVTPLSARTLNKLSEQAKKLHKAPSSKDILELQQYFGAIAKALPADPEVLPKPPEGGRKFDAGKLDYTLLPFGALEDVVAVLGFGAVKYGRDNWQKVDRQRYVAAAFRHLVAIAGGKMLDEESGKPHAAHLSCCSLFIGEMDKQFGSL